MDNCNICTEKFKEETDIIPKVMSCGDTICINCIKRIKKEKEKFTCPICQKDIYDNIDDMPTNKYVFNTKKLILCDICLEEFDNNFRSDKSPRVLNCGHTFCGECLKNNSNNVIICNFCGQRTEKNVDDLPINKIIIEKIEEEIISSMKYINTEIIDINNLDNSYSVGLMGETGGGKTSINYFFRTGKSLKYTTSTIGYDYVYKYIKYKDKTIKLSLMDTAGQEKFQSLSAGALRGVYGLLLVFSLTPLWNGKEEEYKNADKKRKNEMEENYTENTFQRLEFWLNQFNNFNKVDNRIIYLIGNKVDDEENRIINYKDAKNFADQYGMKYYETSAKTGKNINKVFHDLTHDLLKTFPNKIDKSSVHLKKKQKRSDKSGNSSKCCI